VSIRAVAEAVGVTPPSIYLHFADKNELIFAICERCMDELDRATSEAAGLNNIAVHLQAKLPVAQSRRTRRSLRTISIAGCVAGPVTTAGQEIPPTGTCALASSTGTGTV
jgi:AcrR family transcriptional regulator